MNITLALGGGGVKGFAHIGVLKVLELEGFHIRGISGTSVGGLVGALYAAGYSPVEIDARLREIDQGNLFSRMHGDGPALLGLAGVTSILTELLGERTFDDLRIPLVITATDLVTSSPIIINKGRLLDSVLATSAVPGVFPAMHVDGHLLVDGAVMNPIPVAEARALCPKCPVVAVILSPPLGWQVNLPDGMANSHAYLMTNMPLAYKLAGKLRLAQAFNIFVQSMDLTGLTLMDKQLKLEKPEVIIRPEVYHIGLVDRVDIPETIKLGELAARKALPDIRRALSWQYRIKKKISRIFSPFGS